MLTSQIAVTPRPQPPAKTKCSTSDLKSSPPPPYAVNSNASGTIPLISSMPAQATEWNGLRNGTPMVSPSAEEWLSEHSRGDLTELLKKADGLIKERENDINITSAARRNLHEDGVVLRNKHEAFLRRIPYSPTHSPSASAAVSPSDLTSPLPQSPHYYSASISRLASDISTSIPSPPLRRPLRHTRKISVSQQDIALLSDQNAELLSKLEKIESDSAHADRAGRRKLQKLEKEIELLRGELEQTQVKSEELEKQAKDGFGIGAERALEEAWRRKLEREQKIKAMRGGSNSETGSEEIKDFAPGSRAIPRGSSPDATPVKHKPKSGSSQVSPQPLNFPSKHDSTDDIFSTPRSRELSAQHYNSSSPGELAVVSQLLFKIQELEETNTQIYEQQAKAAQTLYSVQKDAASIRRVYETLGDTEGVEWELVTDENQQTQPRNESHSPSDETIRFHSFRRSLDSMLGESIPSGEDFFSYSIGGPTQSTVNGAAINKVTAGNKTRKSVVGLFETLPSTDISPSPNNQRLPVPFVNTDTADSGRLVNDSLHSPTLSTLSIAPPSPSNENVPTLGSELGSEFGDDWGVNAGNHHLRNTSLYQLSAPSGPSSPALAAHSMPAFATAGHQLHEQYVSHDHSTQTKNSSRTVADQTPTPGDISRGHQTDRYRRMSQTVRSRTNQWVDGRFKDTLLGSRDVPRRPQGEKRPETRRLLTPIPQSLASVFDSVVGTLAGTGDRNATPLEADNDDDLGKAVVKSRKDSTITRPNKPQPEGVGKVVLELWLWLQFIIIILVFLWAVAKRGPRKVVGEAERRRVVSNRQS